MEREKVSFHTFLAILTIHVHLKTRANRITNVATGLLTKFDTTLLPQNSYKEKRWDKKNSQLCLRNDWRTLHNIFFYRFLLPEVGNVCTKMRWWKKRKNGTEFNKTFSLELLNNLKWNSLNFFSSICFWRKESHAKHTFM